MATEIICDSLFRCVIILRRLRHSLALVVRLNKNIYKSETVFSITVKSQLNEFKSTLQMAEFISRLLFDIGDLWFGRKQFSPHPFLILNQLLILSVEVLELLLQVLVVLWLALILFQFFILMRLNASQKTYFLLEIIFVFLKLRHFLFEVSILRLYLGYFPLQLFDLITVQAPLF